MICNVDLSLKKCTDLLSASPLYRYYNTRGYKSAFAYFSLLYSRRDVYKKEDCFLINFFF